MALPERASKWLKELLAGSGASCSALTSKLLLLHQSGVRTLLYFEENGVLQAPQTVATGYQQDDVSFLQYPSTKKALIHAVEFDLCPTLSDDQGLGGTHKMALQGQMLMACHNAALWIDHEADLLIVAVWGDEGGHFGHVIVVDYGSDVLIVPSYMLHRTAGSMYWFSTTACLLRHGFFPFLAYHVLAASLPCLSALPASFGNLGVTD
jgi:hypothetical protein